MINPKTKADYGADFYGKDFEAYAVLPDSPVQKIKSQIFLIIKNFAEAGIRVFQINKELAAQTGIEPNYSHINTALEQLEIDGRIRRDDSERFTRFFVGSAFVKTQEPNPSVMMPAMPWKKKFLPDKPLVAARKPKTKKSDNTVKKEKLPPFDYVVPNKRLSVQAFEALAAMGSSKNQAIKALDTTSTTFYAYLKKKPEFREAWERGVAAFAAANYLPQPEAEAVVATKNSDAPNQKKLNFVENREWFLSLLSEKQKSVLELT